MRRLISFGSAFETQGGYSRAVVDGEWVFVAGTTGFDYAAMTIAEDPAEQTRNVRNIERPSPRRRSSPMRAVRYYVPNRDDWRSCRCWRGFRRDPPAATAFLRPVDPRMKIEIEVPREGSNRLTDEQRLLRDTAREFARNELAPHAAEWDREARFPAGGAGRTRPARLYGHAGAAGIWRGRAPTMSAMRWRSRRSPPATAPSRRSSACTTRSAACRCCSYG